MRIDVITLFPEIFRGYLSESMLKKAIERGIVEVHLHNLRDWATDKHRTVDDKPFGGGPGMVLRVDRVVPCVEDVRAMDEDPGHLVMLTPQGRRLNQAIVEELAGHRRLILLCGRYEGFDERVRLILRPDEISIGDYVLNGGEVAAMVIIDAVVRLVPGFLGDEDSSRQDSFSGPDRLLEHAQYTRPREYRGYRVPEILLSGDHQAVAEWRQQNRVERTRRRRPELLNEGWRECWKDDRTRGPVAIVENVASLQPGGESSPAGTGNQDNRPDAGDLPKSP
jgi:tRNA (guanine37-N1)-methyltransferase